MRKSLIGLIIGLLLGAAVTVGGQSFPPQIQIAINQLVTGVTPFTALRNVASAYVNWGSTGGESGYGLRDFAGTLQAKNSGGSWENLVTGSSSGAPADATYWVRTANATLSNETIMGALGTGVVLNTTTTGVPTIYNGASCTNQFVRSLNTSAAATCETVSLTADTTGTLTVAKGGTGLTAGTSGGILGFTASGTLASSAALTANALLLGGGAGAVPTAMASLGTTTTVLHGNAAGAPTFGAVSLTADVSGILPTANGGTGMAFFTVAGPTVARTFTFPDADATVLTSNAAVTAAQGGTGQSSYTIGDLLQASAGTTLSKLAATSTGNVLLSGGVATVSSWGKVGLSTHITGTLGVTNGGSGFSSYTTGDLLYANSTTTLARLNDVAVGSVLISGGVGTAPAWSATPRLTSISLGSANLTFSGDSPSIASGFGTTPAVAGTATAFRITVGSGGSDTAGVVTLPTAATAWNCHVDDLTALAANAMDQRTVQTASSTTSVTFENQTVSTGAATAWTAADVLAVICAAY